jgi:hypothetical protein
LANNKKVIIILKDQLTRVSSIDPKLKEGGKFSVSQIVATATIVNNLDSPRVAGVPLAKKF